MPVVRATASIDVPIAHAWTGLTDLSSYCAWNPFIPHIDGLQGPLGVGSAFCLEVKWLDGSGSVKAEERVTVFQPPASGPDGVRRAVFSYAPTGLLARLWLVRAGRTHVLTQRPGGPTLYETEERFTGALAALVPLRKVQAGFDAQTAAMKERLESTT